MWIGQTFFGRNLLRLLDGERSASGEDVWKTLNWAWIGFFAFMGVLNPWVAFNFETATWVSQTVRQRLGLMLVFTLAQGFYLASAGDRPAGSAGDAPAAAAASKVHEEVR